MSDRDYLTELNEFEAHYQYDTTYLRALLESSPHAYAKFADFRPLASHREKLEPETYWVAKLATMQVEDCGECLQLNVRMALENGISRQLIESVLQGGSGLSEELRDLYDYAVKVASATTVEQELEHRIQARFDRGSLLELGLCIASAKVFPTIKRALGSVKSCQRIEIEV
ncbi:MAG: carboxymuconolactone decarboxylase family protein [Gimesia sp.]